MNRSNWTAYRYSTKNTNIFNQSTVTNNNITTNRSWNDPKNNTPISSLRISGIITLCLTIVTYVGLHVLASQHRRHQQKQRRRHSSTARAAAAGRPHIHRPTQPPPPPSNYYDVVSDDDDDDNNKNNWSGDHHHMNTTSGDDVSPSPLTPAVATTIVSGVVDDSTRKYENGSSNSSSSSGSNCSNNIPNVIVAKPKNRGKKSRVTTSYENDDQHCISSDMTTTHTLPFNTTAALGPQDLHLETTTKTAVDDDEVRFYEQTLQYNHHAQRENITLQHDELAGRGAGNTFVVSSFWVTTEDSFLVVADE